MPFELVYTSASRGLRPGSVGFCTVARHENMPEGLVLDLEKLSGFDLPPGIENVQAIYSFLTVERPTEKYWVFCRKRVCAIPDYSGRINYIAHHLILNEKEVERLSQHPGFAVTPASVLLSFNWRSEFEGDAHMIVEERTLESIFEAAFNDKEAIHDVRWFLGEQNLNREQYFRIPFLFSDEIQPKSACFIDSSLHSETGARNLLKLLHCATLMSSPWLGNNCGEDLFPCSSFPILPHHWWDWGLTTMLIHNDKSIRFCWIGVSEERGATATGASRFKHRLDQWRADESKPNILRDLVEDPQRVLKTPHRIREERKESRIDAELSTKYTSLEKELNHAGQLVHSLEGRHRDYGAAVELVSRENDSKSKLVDELENVLTAIIGIDPLSALRFYYKNTRTRMIEQFSLRRWGFYFQKFLAIQIIVNKRKENLTNAHTSYSARFFECGSSVNHLNDTLGRFKSDLANAVLEIGERGERACTIWTQKVANIEIRIGEMRVDTEKHSCIENPEMYSTGDGRFQDWIEVSRSVIKKLEDEERQQNVLKWKARLSKNRKLLLIAGCILVFLALIYVVIRFRSRSSIEKENAVKLNVPAASKPKSTTGPKSEQHQDNSDSLPHATALPDAEQPKTTREKSEPAANEKKGVKTESKNRTTKPDAPKKADAELK